MLEIRPIAWQPFKRDRFNPMSWIRCFRHAQSVGKIADWLHNLAAFSAADDDGRFWSEFESLRKKQPDVDVYEGIFKSADNFSRTGEWSADGNLK